MEKKKILFVTENKALAELFCNTEVAEKCRKYGFELDVPVLNDDFSAPDWQKLAGDYDALATTWRSPCISVDFLKDAPRVKIVGHCAGSVATVTDESLYHAGIKVTTANLVMSRAVAEWSLLATLLAQRNFGLSSSFGRKFPMNWKEHFNMGNIHRMTIGMWGLGSTTRHLLKLLAPWEPGRILITSEHASEDEISALGAEKVDMDTLLRESDIFHCLVGITPKTAGKISAEEFSAMKDGAVFINCGRARLCIEDALIRELKTGRIRAVLDVFHQEPLPEDSPLYDLDNVIMTPHNAGYPGRDGYLSFILDEFDRFFRREELLSEVSIQHFKSMTNEKMCR